MLSDGKPFRLIQSICRMDEILIAIAEADGQGLRLAEISSRTGIHKNTVFTLLKTMKALGYCNQDARTHAYTVGLRTFELARFAEQKLDIVTQFRPLMLKLVWQWHENLSLAIPAPDHCMVVTTIEGRYGLRGSRFQGQHASYHASALGKAILAFLPEDEKKQVLSRIRLDKLTSRTIDTPAKLKVECDAVRARGYALSVAEEEVGASAVAIPLFSRSGLVAGSLALWGPSARLNRQTLATFGARLAEEAKDITPSD